MSGQASPGGAAGPGSQAGRPTESVGVAGRIARAFLDSKLTPLLIVASLLLGGFAVMVTPREEEPQIQVPMIDVFAGLPGATAREVERLVTTPLEKALYEIDGVEYVYSTSQPSGSLVIVRFLVGSDPDEAVVRVHAKVAETAAALPPGTTPPVVAPRSIDDVPVVAYTLWSETAEPVTLRRIAAEVRSELATHPRVSEVTLIGGRRRVVEVRLDRQAMAARGVSPLQVSQALAGLDARIPAGSFASGDREVEVHVGARFRTVSEVGAAVVAVSGDGAESPASPVYLRDVAALHDGPQEPVDYVWMLAGAAGEAVGLPQGLDAAAVTLAVAKKPGTNAIDLVNDLDTKLDALRADLLPAGVGVTKTRDYGFTADEKSSELIKHLWIATLAVVGLMAVALGRREAVVVLVAVPTTLALTMASSYLFGYTLNRVTLFALIFAIGILVDDAIVVVENIHRHYQLGWTDPRRATVFATDEVGNPTILATFTVVAALLPLAFVSGLMGPYMRPIPINAAAAMVFSLLVAFVVSPWLTYRLFRRHAAELAAGEHAEDGQQSAAGSDGRFVRVYRALFGWLLARAWRRWTVLGAVALLFLASVALFAVRAVTVKMLPFDNKSEVQVIVDMPEGSTLESTAGIARRLAESVRELPEVTDVQVYAGASAPFNFNGLVRHYFLRSGPTVADLQVNLLPKHERATDSHDFAKALRERLLPLVAGTAANLKVTEVPPGPPVLSTLVAEVYGPDPRARVELAASVREIFESTPGVVDVDWLVEAPGPEVELVVDGEKAARAGVSPAAAAHALRLALAGAPVATLRDEAAREQVPVVLRLERVQRSGVDGLLAVEVPGSGGGLVPLAELVTAVVGERQPFVYHKNLQPVTYVLAEAAGAQESPVYSILAMNRRLAELAGPDGRPVAVLSASMPTDGGSYAIKWDGEWQITYEVFRDMGIAFAVVMVLIYVLVVGWFRSFVTPFIIMAPIPLTLVGILPAHALFGVFFTATSMIGFIALAGIIVRNSILLVDFIHLELANGEPIESAVVRAGIVRFRPIALTAAALVVGGTVILLDPIFQGLAVSLIAGVVVSTGLTLVVIPLLYAMYVKTVGVESVRGGGGNGTTSGGVGAPPGTGSPASGS
ncbi:MAG TPA: efflux RND transporter permease subunit [Thermoanaerobaculia bacterium]|nr:efflux RND transporter permease subunit [Thermoanaerobaculia bacterium]